MIKIDQAVLDNILIEVKKDALNSGREITFPTKGRSMLPLLITNSKVIVAKCRPEDYRSGDMILYQAGKDNITKFIAHRLIRKIRDGQGYLFITKGDACFRYDRPVCSDMALGRIKKIKKFGFNISFDDLAGRLLNDILLLFSVSNITPICVTILRRIKILGMRYGYK